MKSFLVTDVYEIINCHSPLVHSPGNVLANRNTDVGDATNFVADIITVQNCWTHTRPCI